MRAVHLVAVNYFGSGSAGPFLDSLRRQTRDDWALSIVDNSCDTDEAARLKDLADGDERVEVLTAPKNLGYYGGAHWWETGRNGRLPLWTLPCNVDLELADDFVERLLDSDSGQYVTAPSVRADPVVRQQNPYLVNRPTVREALVWATVFHWPLTAKWYARAAALKHRSAPHRSIGEARDIYAAHGSIMAIHRRFFEAGGTMRHGAFLFGEEITIAEQVRRFGGTVRFEPGIRVVHREHQATGAKRSRRIRRMQGEGTLNTYRLIKQGS
jgi:GT2 family glycosyltransferase